MAFRPGVRIGVDVGSVRVGVAVCDRDGILASPIETLPRDEKGFSDLERLGVEARERDVLEIVVGLPRSMDGVRRRAADLATAYAADLAARVSPIPVRLVDERLSTVDAHRVLRSAQVKGRKQRKVVDTVAAVIILQHAVDVEHSTGAAPGGSSGRPTPSGQGRTPVTTMSDPYYGDHGDPGDGYGDRGEYGGYADPGADEGISRSEERHERRRRQQRRRRTLAFVIVLVVVIGAGGFLAVGPLKTIVSGFSGGGGDYPGSGTGSVSITIPEGTSGQGIATILVDKGVIKSAKPFLDAVKSSGQGLQAGDYSMKTHMSGASAFQLLLNPPKLPTMTIPEGFRLTQIVDRIVKSTGLSKADVDAATKKKPSDYGLPSDFPNLEGTLFPATYDIKPHQTAVQVVQEMVDRYQQEISTLGIKKSDELKTVTLASLVQVESPGAEDVRKKVAQVFLNRISPDNHETAGRLQSDATVAYIFGAHGDLTTTPKERESDSPYNTYKVKGLPPGPINSPGTGALQAAMNPTPGPWLYFVATDPDTGETAFATTYAEHQKNVQKYQEWLAQHNSKSTG